MAPESQQETTTDARRYAEKYDPRRLAIAGFLTLIIGGLGSFIWAAQAELVVGASADGVVSVESRNRIIDHLEGGQLKRVHVREGARVARDELLATLDDTRARVTVQILSAQLTDAALALARLKAERRGEARFSPDPASFSDLAEHHNADEIAEKVLRNQELFAARKQQYSGRLAILQRRVTQLSERTNSLLAEEKARDRQLTLIRREISSLRGLVKRGNAPKSRLLALEREAARLEGERARFESDRLSAHLRVGEGELEIVEFRDSHQRSLAEELDKVSARYFDLRSKLLAAQDVLRRTKIRAPAAGLVTALQAPEEGGVIGPGQELMRIVPENEPLIVRAQISLHDIDVVRSGMPAELRFPGFDQRHTPTLRGEVKAVSPDASIDAHSGKGYYLAEVIAPSAELMKLGEQRKVIPGMPAEVLIVAGNRSVLDYLIAPLRSVLDKSFHEG